MKLKDIKDKIKDFLTNIFGKREGGALGLPPTKQSINSRDARKGLRERTKATTVEDSIKEISKLRDKELAIGANIKELIQPIINQVRSMNPFIKTTDTGDLKIENLDDYVGAEIDPVEKLVNEVIRLLKSCYRNFYDDADLATNLDQYIAAVSQEIDSEQDTERKEFLNKRLEYLKELSPEQLAEMERLDPFTGDKEHILERVNNPQEKTYEAAMLGLPITTAYSDYMNTFGGKIEPGRTVPFANDLIEALAPIALEIMNLEREQRVIQGEKFGRMYPVINTTDRNCALPQELSKSFSSVDAYCENYTQQGMKGLVDRLVTKGINGETIRAIVTNVLQYGGKALRSESTIEGVINPLINRETAVRATGNVSAFDYRIIMYEALSGIAKGMTAANPPMGHRVFYYYDRTAGMYKTAIGTEKLTPDVPQIQEKN